MSINPWVEREVHPGSNPQAGAADKPGGAFWRHE